jgi:hypothetical protein
MPVPGANNNVFVAASGSYSVQLTDTNNCSATSGCVTVTGLNDPTTSGEILVYPNPADTYLNINWGSRRSGNLRLFDIMGNQILTTDFKNESSVIIDLNNISAAMYILKITTDDMVLSRKIIVE